MQEQVHPFVVQYPRNVGAESAGAAGDQCDLVGEWCAGGVHRTIHGEARYNPCIVPTHD